MLAEWSKQIGLICEKKFFLLAIIATKSVDNMVLNPTDCVKKAWLNGLK